MLESSAHGGLFQNLLFLNNGRMQMSGDAVGKFFRIRDLFEGCQHFGREFFAEFGILAELRNEGTRERLDVVVFRRFVFALHGLDGRLEEIFGLRESVQLRALQSLDHNLCRSVGEFQQLQYRGDGADGVNVFGFRVVLAAVALGEKEDLLVVLHGVFECTDGFGSSDEQRHDHFGEHNNVPKR